ncbi:MAG: serine protease [Gemmatimonadetes bacterium]|nr:serine protease [Gemmatimonadota bacterium]
MIVTNNVLRRTFHIRWKDCTGTGFVIDHESKEYLITARHVVCGIKSGDTIEVFQDGQWRSLAVSVVGMGEDDVDVAVLACPIRLCPRFPLVPLTGSLLLGQPISFLGYPFGWDSGGEQINRGVPLPFVKAGIVSALEVSDRGLSRIFLDAHGNKGFSGGPVVFVPSGKPQNEFEVAGIVSHYPTPLLTPVVNRNGDPVTDQEGEPIGYVAENPGIVVAISINYALELIGANPIGLQVTS